MLNEISTESSDPLRIPTVKQCWARKSILANQKHEVILEYSHEGRVRLILVEYTLQYWYLILFDLTDNAGGKSLGCAIKLP